MIVLYHVCSLGPVRIDVLRKSCFELCWEVITTHCVGHSKQDVKKPFITKVISDIFFEPVPTAKVSGFRKYIVRQTSQLQFIQSNVLQMLLQVEKYEL